MKVEKTHHIDCSNPDEYGMYEYYYEYDFYIFKEGLVEFTARSYVDSFEEVRFLRIKSLGITRFIKKRDLQKPLLKKAIQHLKNEGKKSLNGLVV